MDIYVFHDNQQSGPFTLEAVRQMVECGTLPAEVLVWHEGAPDWMPLSALTTPASPGAPTVKVVAGRPAASAARPRVETAAPPPSFFAALPGAFSYPLRKDGIFLLVGGALFFGLLGYVQQLSMGFRGLITWALGLMVAVIATGYLYCCMQRIIQASAQGEEAMPQWPEFGDMWQDIVLPCLQFLVILLVCFGPAWFITSSGDPPLTQEAYSRRQALWTALVALGSLYFPMALLAVAMADSLAALNPVVVLGSIFRVPGQYAVTWVLLLVLYAAGPWSARVLGRSVPIPFVVPCLTGVLSMYLLTVEMRILGLLYYTNRARLKCF